MLDRGHYNFVGRPSILKGNNLVLAAVVTTRLWSPHDLSTEVSAPVIRSLAIHDSRESAIDVAKQLRTLIKQRWVNGDEGRLQTAARRRLFAIPETKVGASNSLKIPFGTIGPATQFAQLAAE